MENFAHLELARDRVKACTERFSAQISQLQNPKQIPNPVANPQPLKRRSVKECRKELTKLLSQHFGDSRVQVPKYDVGKKLVAPFDVTALVTKIKVVTAVLVHKTELTDAAAAHGVLYGTAYKWCKRQ